MPVKNQNLINIQLSSFYKDLVKKLKLSTKETLTLINDNNIPIMHIITPKLFKKFISLEKIVKNIYFNTTSIKKGKFSMYFGWHPDNNFLKKANSWGINLTKPPSKSELTLFISYWQVEKRFFYHIQWEQKLARSLEKSRKKFFTKHQRDINKFPNPDKIIPNGFRGK